MANPEELSRYIRFQLAQLRARNGHHEFEHIARHFSRLRISERIIPATGPVGAGGDAGRDFETYRSYLASTPIASSTFLAGAAGKTLVFSCSLKTNIEGKIKSDAQTICGGGHQVDGLFYFCEPDVPIGLRNKLKKHCKDKFNVELTIFDGAALAENLVNPDVFWIAQQYLGIPAEMYPKPLEPDENYDRSREKWIGQSRTPISFADFTEVKAGLRQATFDSSRKADLLSWMGLMNTLREGTVTPLRRRATYEICVTALRGLNDLSSRRDLVTEYFANIAELADPIDLRDATILLSYCSSAAVYGHFDMDPAVLHGYTSTLIRSLDARLSQDLTPSTRCALLEIRGTAESLWFGRGTSPKLNPAGMVGFWTKMLRLVPSAPLFPLDSFADLLTLLAPHFAGDTAFEHLTQRTDELLEKRTSGFVAADKARDRAVAFLDDDKTLYAIRQLHIAKIKWFSAETLRGSVLSILVLSDCYLRLGLIYASKYYSAAALALASSANSDDVKRLIPGALRTHFDACYTGGEWFTAATLIRVVFAAHNGYDPGAYDISESDRLRSPLVHLSILRALTRKLAPPALISAIERMGDDWPVGPGFRELVDELADEASTPWEDKDRNAIRAQMEADLFGRPFLDVGRKRTVVWRALGIRWTVTSDNERDVVALCEEFLATLQIVLADLATTDLVLLPTAVHVEMTVTAGSTVGTSEATSNEEARWRVELPRRLLGEQRNARKLVPEVIALVSVMLGKCSTLSRDAFHVKLEAAFKAGLFEKTMVVRPYAQLYSEIIGPEDFEADVRSRHDPLFVREDFYLMKLKS
jgi:hypothetical protein